MTRPGELWKRSAAEANGPDYASRYAAHFDRLTEEGQDVHGEVAFLSELIAPGARVLDAGCGTGRIATRLADLGFHAEGVDVDEAMIEEARIRRPDLSWHHGDLEHMDFGTFDAIVSAGNVIPFIDPATYPLVAANLRRHLTEHGIVVTGFGLAEEHLPPGALLVDFAAYQRAFEEAGFVLSERFGGWGREGPNGEYAVAVFRRATD
jgi:SAM-dependent methyltransferase